MADVPHLALPFRYVGGAPAVNEQDSPDDVAACVEAVLRTRPGQRAEHPDFGAPDPTFAQRPLDLDAVVVRVETWEPRAHALAEEHPDVFDETVSNVLVTLED